MSNEREEIECAVLLLEHAKMLWKLPLLTNDQVPIALGISQSTWQLLKRAGTTPPCVMIGGRGFYRPADLRAWIDNMETKKNPGDEAGVHGLRSV